MTKEKIAILGSGVASMTTACYLTEQKNWQDKYDITVYQLGWRLGGKGASGRNPEYGQRIEEHGLHVWFGAYVNSFKTIEAVYNELDRPADMPLATWQEAFKPHDFIVLMEKIKDEWQSWGIDFPEVKGNPADGTLELTFWEVVTKTIAWLKKFLQGLLHHSKELNCKTDLQEHEDGDKSWWQHLIDNVKSDVNDFTHDVRSAIDLFEEFASGLVDTLDDADDKHYAVLGHWLDTLKKWLTKEFDHLLDDHPDIRHFYVGVDLAITVLKGLLADKVYIRGFGYLNQWDLMDWLAMHGANEKYTVKSAPIRGFYDLAFAYENGDFNKPNFEAGVSLLAILRVALCYHGGFMYKMQAGMGDTIFSPIYELLKRRGVKFEYFHKVDQLLTDGEQITEIKITKQVELKGDEYDPFVIVKDLPCWPSIPNYDQINDEQATLLKVHGINLESFWTDWPEIYQKHFNKSLPKLDLKLGEDFDKVVFGISVGSLPHLCADLLAIDEPLKTASDNIGAVATQAYQVWTDVPFEGLGWTDLPPSGQEPILSAFGDPFDTWAAMNQLLIREDWQGDLDPKNVAYFCSAQGVSHYPPKTDHEFPKITKKEAKENAIAQLETRIYNLWPDIATPDSFDWSVLTDPKEQEGVERFNSQFWRSNVDPSERYVLSLTGTSKYRLETDGTIFSNLLITGDWINTGVNAGCVEAAVMAGMETSRAICGHPKCINGENGFAPFQK